MTTITLIKFYPYPDTPPRDPPRYVWEVAWSRGKRIYETQAVAETLDDAFTEVARIRKEILWSQYERPE